MKLLGGIIDSNLNITTFYFKTTMSERINMTGNK